MRRSFAFLIILLALASARAQEPSTTTPPDQPAETEKTIIVEGTGGERNGAKQPNLDQVSQQIVEQTNTFREEQKRKPLKVNKTLTKAAQKFADYMAKTGRYGHLADERTPDQRAEAAGYEYCIVSENIAYAFRTDGFATDELTRRLVTGWKESPGHRRNMLARHVVEIGVAVAKSEETDTYFAVQLFGRPRSMAIGFEVVNKSEMTIRYRLGDQELSLPPRVVRTHEGCTSQEVTFLATDSETSDSAKPKTFKASGGERFTVEPAKTGYGVTVEELDE